MTQASGSNTTTQLSSRKLSFTQRRLEKKIKAHLGDKKIKQIEFSDTTCAGLKFIVSCLTGQAHFYQRYRTPVIKKRKVIKIGEFPAVSVELAREIVNDNKALLAKGLDPALEREKLINRPTFEQFSEVYLSEKKHKKSINDDRRKLENQMCKEFKDKILADISRKEYQQYLNKVKANSSNGNHNRHRALLSHLLNIAVANGVVDRNHVASIPKLPESTNHGRQLTPDERPKLLNALLNSVNKSSGLAGVLLLFTGMRRMECLSLRHSDVDLTQNVIRLRAENTKANVARIVHLNSPAVSVLEELKQYRKRHNPYVFPGQNGKHLTTIRKTFETAKKKAGIENFRLHDCRHNFCTMLDEANINLATIQKLAGHQTPAMTKRYIHSNKSDSELISATAVISQQFN